MIKIKLSKENVMLLNNLGMWMSLSTDNTEENGFKVYQINDLILIEDKFEKSTDPEYFNFLAINKNELIAEVTKDLMRQREKEVKKNEESTENNN